MKIGIDISPTINEASGIARYTRQLVENLAKIDKENDYLFYKFSGKKFKLLLLLLNKLNIAPDFLIKKADVFHSTDLTFPCSLKKSSVVTIHDLIFMNFQNIHDWKWKKYMESMARFSSNRADAIIAPSNATKKDIVELLGVNPEKIAVIHEGVEEDFKPADLETVTEIKTKYHLPSKYILGLSTIEPRKNFERLAKACSKLKKEGFEHKLVIVGKKGWGDTNISDEVQIIDFAENSDLPAIYSGADAFIYPSLYEGFGLPILEAMACGTPVICSNTSSMPEVAGDAAILINPEDTDNIAENIAMLLGDKKLQEELTQKGLKRAKKFSWEKTAKETFKIYNKVYEEST